MKVSLTVYQKCSYKDILDKNKIDMFCTKTLPRIVIRESNIESFVKNLIDEYIYTFEKKYNVNMINSTLTF